jgi:hypothetical protein
MYVPRQLTRCVLYDKCWIHFAEPTISLLEEPFSILAYSTTFRLFFVRLIIFSVDSRAQPILFQSQCVLRELMNRTLSWFVIDVVMLISTMRCKLLTLLIQHYPIPLFECERGAESTIHIFFVAGASWLFFDSPGQHEYICFSNRLEVSCLCSWKPYEAHPKGGSSSNKSLIIFW